MVAALVILIPVVVAGVVAIIRTVQRRDDAQRVAIADIHVLVNQRLTDVMARVEQLTRELENAKIRVPNDPAGQ